LFLSANILHISFLVSSILSSSTSTASIVDLIPISDVIFIQSPGDFFLSTMPLCIILQ